MKTWLKGGLWGAGIFVILVILAWLISFLFNKFYFFFLVFYPCILFFSGENGMACIVYGLILNLIISFILGSIIGFIIQKIKSNKQQRE